MLPVFDRPKVIIYRFVDIIVTEGRLKHDYMNMASTNLQPFLQEFFLQKEMADLVGDLREQSYEERDRNTNISTPLVFKPTQTPAAIIGSICFYLNWRMKKTTKKADLGKPQEPDFKLIRWVVAHAMATGAGTITVHRRFAEALKKRHAEGIRQFVYSRMTSTAIDTEHKLLTFTSEGDLTPYISGYFNTEFLNPTDEMSYNLMFDCLGVQPSEVMLMTTRVEECRLATQAGFVAVKVKRPGDEKDRTFPRVKDMSAMAFKDALPPKPSSNPTVSELVMAKERTDEAKAGNSSSSKALGSTLTASLSKTAEKKGQKSGSVNGSSKENKKTTSSSLVMGKTAEAKNTKPVVHGSKVSKSAAVVPDSSNLKTTAKASINKPKSSGVKVTTKTKSKDMEKKKSKSK